MFLDQLCSLYENSFMKNSSQQTESLKTFIEKVSDLADANELPSKGFRALLTGYSVDDVQMQLKKVSNSVFNCLLPLCNTFLLCFVLYAVQR